MSSEKLSTEVELDDENQSTKRISYIAKDLQSMIEFVGKVYSNIGHTSYHTNKAIAAVHGLAADSIKQHLTASQGYRLLELKHRVGYKITDHFLKVFLPKNETEKRSAVIESLKNPVTYQQLFKDYEYNLVPAEGVKNHFIRSLGMKEDMALKATQVFLQNLKDFELLDSRGVLISALPSKPVVPVISPEVGQQEEDGHKGETPEHPGEQRYQPPALNATNEFTGSKKYENHIWIPIHITKGETAVFAYPEGITENDIKIVEHQLAGILLRIRLESEEKK